MQICHSLRGKQIDVSTADQLTATFRSNATLKYHLTLPMDYLCLKTNLLFIHDFFIASFDFGMSRLRAKNYVAPVCDKLWVLWQRNTEGMLRGHILGVKTCETRADVKQRKQKSQETIKQ